MQIKRVEYEKKKFGKRVECRNVWTKWRKQNHTNVWTGRRMGTKISALLGRSGNFSIIDRCNFCRIKTSQMFNDKASIENFDIFGKLLKGCRLRTLKSSFLYHKRLHLYFSFMPLPKPLIQLHKLWITAQKFQTAQTEQMKFPKITLNKKNLKEKNYLITVIV